MDLSLLIIAVGSAVTYAASNIAARLGLKHSTPITMICVSFATQTITLWAAVFLTGGIPEVAPTAVFLFAIVGVFMPLIRFLTYTGIAKIGAARSASLRSTYPLFSAIVAIMFLHEEATRIVILGTVLVVVGVFLISWQPENRFLPTRRWYVLFPLAAAILAGVVHPISRYALGISKQPIFFAALVGVVSLATYLGYLSLPWTRLRPLWDRKALRPFIMAALLETSGFLLLTIALSVGHVVLVTPIVATSPMWVLLWMTLIARDLERVHYRTILGTCLVVSGTVAISLGG